MRKSAFVITIVFVFILVSCKKVEAPFDNAFTFKSLKVPVASCYVEHGNELTASNGYDYPTSLQVYFFDSVPHRGGVYTVATGIYPNSANEVSLSIWIDISGTEYDAVGGTGNTVQVSVSNGKLTVTGRGIKMKDTSSNRDTSIVDINIRDL